MNCKYKRMDCILNSSYEKTCLPEKQNLCLYGGINQSKHCLKDNAETIYYKELLRKNSPLSKIMADSFFELNKDKIN